MRGEQNDKRLILRLPKRLLDLIDAAAGASELDRSEWARGALEQQATREVRPARPVGVLAAGEKCVHPPTALQSFPNRVECSLCGTWVRRTM